jgi:hypothetical protein
MYAKPLQCASGGPAGQANAQAETAFAMLGTMPLAILAIEAVIGFILILVSVLFFATIFFAFVGFILLYVALWIAVVCNGFGVAVSLLTLLAGRRYMTGKVFGISGLLIHLVLLGAGVYGLAGVHSYLAKSQDGPLRQPATYSVPSQEMRPAFDASDDLPTSNDLTE